MERKQTLPELGYDIWDQDVQLGKTKFYLLDGKGKRKCLVNEFPADPAVDYHEKPRELPKIINLENGQLLWVSRVQKENRLAAFDNCQAWKEHQLNSNYRNFATGSWKKALEGHGIPFGCSKPPAPVQKGVAASVEKKKNAPCLEYLPVEVFEQLVPYLDAFSFFNTCKASPNLEIRLMEALGTDTLKKWKYWYTAACGLERDLFLKILTSYDGVAARVERAKANVLRPKYLDSEIKDEFDSLYDFKFEDVCRSAYNLWERLCYAPLIAKNMENMENAIKSFIQISSHERDAKISWDQPKSITQNCGPFLFNVLSPSPWNSDKFRNWRVMEDLERCEMRRTDRISHEEVRYVRVMYVPQFLSTCSPGPGIPRAVRIIIAVCKNSIVLMPLQEGRSQKLTFAPFNSNHWNMDPIVAIHENVFATWQNPQTLQFYKCDFYQAENDSFVESRVIQTVNIYEMLDHWQRISLFKAYYLPVLEKVKGSYETTAGEFQNIFSVHELDQDYYELQLVSLRCGREVIGPRNPFHDRTNGVINHFVMHQYPQYYLQNALEYRDLLETPYTSAQGHGLFVFWNLEAIAVSWDGLTWLFESWKNIVSHLFKGKICMVSHVDIFSPDGIAVVVNHTVLLLHVRKSEGGCELKPQGSEKVTKHEFSEPSLIITAARVVVLQVSCRGLRINHMALDFDKGSPYLFVTFKDENSENGLEFYMTRVTFEYQQEKSQALLPIKMVLNSTEAPEKETAIANRTAEPQAPLSEPSEKEIVANSRAQRGAGDSTVKPKSPAEKYLALDPDLFTLSSYPMVLEKIEKFQKQLKQGVPEWKVKSIRKRCKGEPRSMYENYLESMRTSPTKD